LSIDEWNEDLIAWNGRKHKQAEEMLLHPMVQGERAIFSNSQTTNFYMRTKKVLLEIYFTAHPVERAILQDKARNMTEKAIAKKYLPFDYSYDKIKRLRREFFKLFGRKCWEEIIFEAIELGLIQKDPAVLLIVVEKATDYLVATIELMETAPYAKSHEQKRKTGRKRKRN
jgi:hypothetical protein